MRVSKRSAKYLGRTSRPETPNELQQALLQKLMPSTKITMLDLERKYFPAIAIRAEEETMFYGS